MKISLKALLNCSKVLSAESFCDIFWGHSALMSTSSYFRWTSSILFKRILFTNIVATSFFFSTTEFKLICYSLFFILDWQADIMFLHLCLCAGSILFFLAYRSFSLISLIFFMFCSKYYSTGKGFIPYYLYFFSVYFFTSFISRFFVEGMLHYFELWGYIVLLMAFRTFIGYIIS